MRKPVISLPAGLRETQKCLWMMIVTLIKTQTQCPVQLLGKAKHGENLSCDWLKDNRMVVVGDKSKMIIVGTKERRRIKLDEAEHSIVMDGEVVNELTSEKLIGVVINNTMT